MLENLFSAAIWASYAIIWTKTHFWGVLAQADVRHSPSFNPVQY